MVNTGEIVMRYIGFFVAGTLAVFLFSALLENAPGI
jgi:hypothetical protein